MFGSSVSISGNYAIVGAAGDDSHRGSATIFSVSEDVNDNPNKPTVAGPISGKTGNTYTYTAYTTDPNGDKIYYWFDWGDGTDSGWIGPFNSGQTTSASHVWDTQGSYQVKVKAKDEYDDESVWSDPLSISMPKNRLLLRYLLFLKFLEQHPCFFPILREALER